MPLRRKVIAADKYTKSNIMLARKLLYPPIGCVTASTFKIFFLLYIFELGVPIFSCIYFYILSKILFYYKYCYLYLVVSIWKWSNDVETAFFLWPAVINRSMGRMLVVTAHWLLDLRLLVVEKAIDLLYQNCWSRNEDF